MSHKPGCPAIADDESDFKYLDDAGTCTCGVTAGKGAADEAEQKRQALPTISDEEILCSICDAPASKFTLLCSQCEYGRFVIPIRTKPCPHVTEDAYQPCWGCRGRK